MYNRIQVSKVIWYSVCSEHPRVSGWMYSKALPAKDMLKIMFLLVIFVHAGGEVSGSKCLGICMQSDDLVLLNDLYKQRHLKGWYTVLPYWAIRPRCRWIRSLLEVCQAIQSVRLCKVPKNWRTQDILWMLCTVLQWDDLGYDDSANLFVLNAVA